MKALTAGVWVIAALLAAILLNGLPPVHDAVWGHDVVEVTNFQFDSGVTAALRVRVSGHELNQPYPVYLVDP